RRLDERPGGGREDLPADPRDRLGAAEQERAARIRAGRVRPLVYRSGGLTKGAATMKNVLKGVLAIAAFALAATASAQTKLKWAHVYETSEPYHTAAVWAAAEIKKRTNGRYDVEVFPASTLGKETDINQGLTLGTVDIIYTGQLFAGRTYGPL